MAMLGVEKKALWIVGAIVLIWLAWPKAPETAPARTQARPAASAASRDTQLSYMACAAAHEAVKSHLKAPATADFPDCVFGANHYKVTANDGRTRFAVQGFVDSQNSFGAMMRSDYVVFLDKGPGDGPSAFTPTNVAVE